MNDRKIQIFYADKEKNAQEKIYGSTCDNCLKKLSCCYTKKAFVLSCTNFTETGAKV